MPAVLISIKPEFVDSILSGSKKYELRRRFGKTVSAKSKLLIYASAPVSALVATATIDELVRRAPPSIWRLHSKDVGICKAAFDAYFRGVSQGVALKLTSVRKLSKSVALKELGTRFGIRPPQSFMYVDDLVCRQLIGQHEESTSGHQHLGTPRRQQSRSRGLLETVA